jgi:lipoyl(octanoyl) transferase
VEIQDWGLIDYEQALKKQEELVEKIASEKSEGILVFCSHPAVVTLGRKTQEGDVFAWNGPIKEISRGGRATYHGPSQIVVYPILNLEYEAPGRPKRDIGWFLRCLENSIVKTLTKYDVQATGKSLQKKSTAIENAQEETGVWVGDKKIASLGIAIRKWITFHGAAINIDEDPRAFFGMNPCGFSSSTMISLEKILNKKVDRDKFQQNLLEQIKLTFIV